MTTYRIGPLVSTTDEHYLATATSEAEARALVSRVVPGAAEAKDPTFYCVRDYDHSPPPGVVLSSGGETFSESVA